MHADGGHDGCPGSACAKKKLQKWGAVHYIVCKANKKRVGGPHLILPLKIVPGDGLEAWTDFMKDYP
jgi:hypothetical protein